MFKNIKTAEMLGAEEIANSQLNSNVINLAYLASTDWYITRETETGVPIPADVLLKRQEARDAITGETI